MTERNKQLLDLYTDYLLSSFGATTATGLSHLVPEVSHDQITGFLAQEVLSNKELWRHVKAQVRAVQSAEAVLSIDDTVQSAEAVQEKPYSDESELITWHYDHSVGRTVKGINLLSALYFSQGTSLPVAFELIQKTHMETNTKTGKDKWVCPRSKNEMIAQFGRQQVPLASVLADTWLSCAENMCFIKQKAHTDFIFPLKSNRKVALCAEDKVQGRWQSLSSLDTETPSCWMLYLERVPFAVRVSRHLVKNQGGQRGELFLCSSDVDLSGPTMLTIYQKPWKVEEYHKSLKQNTAFAKSPHTQSNHIFASIVAFCKLEAYRRSTRLNHFALKAKLYHAALRSSFSLCQSLKAALPYPIA